MFANKSTYLMQDIFLCCTPHYFSHEIIQWSTISLAVWSINKILPPPKITVWIYSQELHQAK